MDKQPEYSVYLSYANEDRAWVAKFASALLDRGVNACVDTLVQPGKPWSRRTQDALRSSKTLVLVLSRNSIGRPWTFFEIGAAIADHKRIIPVATEDVPVDQVASILSKYRVLKESSPRAAGRRVAEELQKAA